MKADAERLTIAALSALLDAPPPPPCGRPELAHDWDLRYQVWYEVVRSPLVKDFDAPSGNPIDATLPG